MAAQRFLDEDKNIKLGVWPSLGNHDYFNNVPRGFGFSQRGVPVVGTVGCSRRGRLGTERTRDALQLQLWQTMGASVVCR